MSLPFHLEERNIADNGLSHRECTQALLDVLIPDEDLKRYTQIEERIRESEEHRHQQLEEAQDHIKGKEPV